MLDGRLLLCPRSDTQTPRSVDCFTVRLPAGSCCLRSVVAGTSIYLGVLAKFVLRGGVSFKAAAGHKLKRYHACNIRAEIVQALGHR